VRAKALVQKLETPLPSSLASLRCSSLVFLRSGMALKRTLEIEDAVDILGDRCDLVS